jgi:ATPase subunit of ABC transporter with duplicated ATPase domains
MFNQMLRDLGDQVLQVENLTKVANGETLFKNVSFTINKGDKVAILSQNSLATTALHDVLSGRDTDFTGEFKWGVTAIPSSLPIENAVYFEGKDDNLVDWLREYSKEEKDETFIRSFLGRMLFSGEEVFKKSSVLSGGEKMRCMFSKMMLEGPNVLLLDEPTNHLDLESITALNNGMKDFKGVILLTSRDHELTETVANRVIEITPKGALDKMMDYDEYISSAAVKQQKAELYGELA